MTFPHDHATELRAILDALRETPDDPYWCRRLVEHGPSPRYPDVAEWLVHAYATWASYDPAWFVLTPAPTVAMRFYSMHWPMDLVERAEERITIADDRIRHIVLGRLWMAAKPLLEDADPFIRRAAAHFAHVPRWSAAEPYVHERAEALAVADPKRLLEETPDDWHDRRDWQWQRAIRIALGAAMRAEDWRAYARYRALAVVDGRGALEILHLDGLKALALGDDRALGAVLRDLLVRGRNVAHLSTPHCIAFVEATIAHGKRLRECRRYVAMLHACDASSRGDELLAAIDRRIRVRRRGGAKKRRR